MKKLVSVVFCLLLLSGCRPRRKQVVYTSKPHQHTFSGKSSKSTGTTSATEEMLEEELDGFVLLDDLDEEMGSQDGMNVGSYKDIYLDEDDISLVDDRDVDEYGFKTAYFDFDRSNIRQDQLPVFEQNAQAMKKAIAEGKKIVIEGHADNAAGSRAYNLQLSQKRAQTAADWFIKNGIRADSIKVIGRGSEMLIVPSGDKNAQAPNRRVQIYTIAASAS